MQGNAARGAAAQAIHVRIQHGCLVPKEAVVAHELIEVVGVCGVAGGFVGEVKGSWQSRCKLALVGCASNATH